MWERLYAATKDARIYQSGRKASPTLESQYNFAMNPATPPSFTRHRSVGWWIALGLGLLLTPLVLLGVGAISMLTLDRDAALLRREVMAATEAKWHTKVQLDLGWVTLGAVRTGLRFIHHEHIAEARMALQAVRRASVGVYERDSQGKDVSREVLLAHTDQTMGKRGWTRLVGVINKDESVLIYVSGERDSDSRLDLCLAIVNGKELVVVSTNVDADALVELAVQYIPQDKLRTKLKLAKLGF